MQSSFVAAGRGQGPDVRLWTGIAAISVGALTLAEFVLQLVLIIVFISGFRQLITRIRPDLQWVTGIMYGSGLLLVAVTLVADALQGGTALDTTGLAADSSSIRTLLEGRTLLSGSIGATLIALVTASAAYVTIASGALPRWTGYLAYAVAVLNLLSVPTMFGGTSPESFLAAGGGATLLLATFPWLIWVVCVGFVAIRDRRRLGRPPGSLQQAPAA